LGVYKGGFFLPLIVHPHPDPLPSREREKYREFPEEGEGKRKRVEGGGKLLKKSYTGQKEF